MCYCDLNSEVFRLLASGLRQPQLHRGGPLSRHLVPVDKTSQAVQPFD